MRIANGSGFESLLEDEGILDEVDEAAVKRVMPGGNARCSRGGCRKMNEPQPMLGYLLVIFLIAAGMTLILSARKIVEFDPRINKRMLAHVENWHPVFKFPFALRLSIGPETHVLSVRFSGAILILFAMILVGLAIRANL